MCAYSNAFSYDGTFEGFLCVAVRCINMRLIPLEIKRRTEDGSIQDLQYNSIRTNKVIADKMYALIGKQGSREIQQMIYDLLLTCIPDKEIDTYIFICKILKFGAVVAEYREDEVVRRIHLAIQDLYREAQAELSRLDLVSIDGHQLAVINPRNNVLPVVKDAILHRIDGDKDVDIYDKRHRLLLQRHAGIERIIDTYGLLNIDTDNVEDLYKQLITDVV